MYLTQCKNERLNHIKQVTNFFQLDKLKKKKLDSSDLT